VLYLNALETLRMEALYKSTTFNSADPGHICAIYIDVVL